MKIWAVKVKFARNMKKPFLYLIKTYGCQFNYSDSERIASVLEGIGISQARAESEADLIIFNTCSVRQKAEDRVFGMMPLISELKKKRPRLRVAITGCMVKKTSTKKSQVQDDLVKSAEALDFVFRIEELALLPELLEEVGFLSARLGTGKPWFRLRQGLPRKSKAGDGIDSATLKNYFKIVPKYVSSFQAFVPISTGCDNFCAYCVVPYTRGRERSRSMNEILEECEKLVSNGCKEIILLGQNVDSYGLSYLDRKEKRFKPLKSGEKIYFTRLLEKLDKLSKKGLARVRWTSPHPKDLSDDVISAVARLKTQMPYIHLPVQAGSNAVLRKMNRPYTREHYLGLIAKIRKAIPDCAISTDIIVGFCGETREMFEETYSLYKKARFDMAYLAQYSKRPRTAAYRIMKDDVPVKEKSKRWHKLNNLLTKISLEKHKAFVGKIVEVLVERCAKRICEGRSEHFKRVQFPGGKELIGQIVPVKVKKALEWNLRGDLLSPHA